MKIKQGKMVRGALIILGITGLAWASGPNLDRARKLYNLTEFEQSLKVLQAAPEQGRRRSTS